MAEIIEGAIHRYHYEHRVIIEGGKPIQINLHQTGDVASHKEIISTLGAIMAKLDDYITQQKAFNEAIAADVGAISTSLTAINGDVDTLNQKITDLMALGGLTAEQQAALDDLAAAGTALAAKTRTVSQAASVLDDRTPPVAPPTP